MAIADLLAYGRWASTSAAILYIRKGETALARFANSENQATKAMIASLAALCAVAWKIPEVFTASEVDIPSVVRVSPVVFNSLIDVFTNLFRV